MAADHWVNRETNPPTISNGGDNIRFTQPTSGCEEIHFFTANHKNKKNWCQNKSVVRLTIFTKWSNCLYKTWKFHQLGEVFDPMTPCLLQRLWRLCLVGDSSVTNTVRTTWIAKTVHTIETKLKRNWNKSVSKQFRNWFVSAKTKRYRTVSKLFGNCFVSVSLKWCGQFSVRRQLFVAQEVGCDDVIGSDRKVDSCGVCGGRNDSCTRTDSIVLSQPGYQHAAVQNSSHFVA